MGKVNALRGEQLSEAFNLLEDPAGRLYAVTALPEGRGRTESTLERTTATDFQKDLFTGICPVEFVGRNRQTIQFLNQFAHTAIHKTSVLNAPQGSRHPTFITITFSR